MVPFVIPTSLPTRKAELVEMCKKAGLVSVGTVAELRKRLIDKATATARTVMTTASRVVMNHDAPRVVKQLMKRRCSR